MKYTHEWHCVHGIFYHLVLVVAYRHQVMTEPIRTRCLEIIEELSSGFAVEILQAEGGLDHLHLLLKAKPHTTLSKFVNSIKTVTSRRLKQEFPFLKKLLWKEKFWSRSYFAASTGGAPLEAVRRYIEEQRR